MPNDTAIIKADGVVTIAQLRVVVDALLNVLTTLTEEATSNPGAVEWVVEGLKGGSAKITARGLPGTFNAKNAIGLVIQRYERLARQAHDGVITEFPPSVQDAVKQLVELVDGKVTKVSLGTDDHEWGINPAAIAGLGEAPEIAHKVGMDVSRYARSAVKGQIVTLDEKNALYFTLREAHTGQLIRCYPEKRHKKELSEYFGTGNWVIVEGTFSRYTTPATMHHITDIVPIGVGKKGTWREAIGCAPRHPDGQDISSADAVRRIRDAAG
jgi:hypothetical protein